MWFFAHIPRSRFSMKMSISIDKSKAYPHKVHLLNRIHLFSTTRDTVSIQLRQLAIRGSLHSNFDYNVSTKRVWHFLHSKCWKRQMISQWKMALHIFFKVLLTSKVRNLSKFVQLFHEIVFHRQLTCMNQKALTWSQFHRSDVLFNIICAQLLFNIPICTLISRFSGTLAACVNLF